MSPEVGLIMDVDGHWQHVYQPCLLLYHVRHNLSIPRTFPPEVQYSSQCRPLFREYELKPSCHPSQLGRVRHWEGFPALDPQDSPCSPMTLLTTTDVALAPPLHAGELALTRRTAPKELGLSKTFCMAARLSPSKGPTRPTPALFTKGGRSEGYFEVPQPF